MSKSSRYSRQRNVLDRGNSTEAVKGMKYGISGKQQENWCGLSKVRKQETRQVSTGRITEAIYVRGLGSELNRNSLILYLGSGRSNMVRFILFKFTRWLQR